MFFEAKHITSSQFADLCKSTLSEEDRRKLMEFMSELVPGIRYPSMVLMIDAFVDRINKEKQNALTALTMHLIDAADFAKDA